MSSTLSKTVRIITGVLVAVGAWQPIRADDDTTQRRDEARLVLLEEHVEGIATAANDVTKFLAASRLSEAAMAQSAIDKQVDAFNFIVTDYFLGRRIKPAASGDEQTQRDVSLLHEMIVQTTQCREGNADQACKKLVSLIESFRRSLNDESNPVKKPKDTPKEKQDDPKKDGVEGKSDAEGKNEDESQLSETEELLFKLVNAYRKKQGLAPLRIDEKLCQAARDHSGDMKKHSFFSHQSPVAGRTRFTDRANSRGALANAENIARDCKDPRMAMKLWVNSQAHRANLTGPQTRMGVGVTENGLYTQVFGK